MTAPYIVTSNGATTIALGKVASEEIQIINKISNFAFPTQNTAAALSVNIFGKLRHISVVGMFIGTEAQIDTFIGLMEAWINDGVQTSRIYHDSFANTYYVMCVDFNWSRKTNSANAITYNIVMLESGTT